MTQKAKRMTDKNETAALKKLGDALVEIEEIVPSGYRRQMARTADGRLRPSHRRMGC